MAEFSKAVGELTAYAEGTSLFQGGDRYMFPGGNPYEDFLDAKEFARRYNALAQLEQAAREDRAAREAFGGLYGPPAPARYSYRGNPLPALGGWQKFAKDLRDFGSLGTALGGMFALGPIEGALFELASGWAGTAGTDTSRNLVIPPGWTLTNGGCSPPQRWWGINQIVACGTPQVRALDTENKVLGIPGPAWVFCTSPSGAVNSVFTRTFNTNGRYTKSGASPGTLPYRQALLSALAADPFQQPLELQNFETFSSRGRALAVYQQFMYEFSPSHPDGPPKPGVHGRTPPPPSVKEKKFTLGKGGWIGAAYGALTELNDLMDCMYASIPKHPLKSDGKINWNHRIIKPNNPNPYEKFRFIFNNAQYMNAYAFTKCYLKKNIGDQLFGRISSATSKAAVNSGYWPFPTGVGISRFASHGTQFPGGLRMR